MLIGRLPDRHWFGGRFLERPLRGGALFRCAQCSLKFRNAAYAPEFYAGLYDNRITTNWQEESSRNDWGRIVAFINGHFPPDVNVLDFGCNTGGLLARLGQHYRKYGIEINKSAAAVAAASSGATVWASMDAIPATLRFDVIVLADVVEHVADPKQLIAALSSFLAKDGVLIITTGDADSRLWGMFGANWWYCVFPEHITFISRAWLGYLSGSTCLTVVHCENFFYRSLSWPRKLLPGFLMVLYGLAPRLYMGLGRIAKTVLRRRGDVPVRGVGLSADHLFIVLANHGFQSAAGPTPDRIATGCTTTPSWAVPVMSDPAARTAVDATR